MSSLPSQRTFKIKKILLPIDIVGAQECSKEVPTKTFSIPEGIAEGWQGLDIGPKTLDLFKKQLSGAKTVLWNGPLESMKSNLLIEEQLP